MKTYIGTLILAVSLSACQSTENGKEDAFNIASCKASDWTAIGYKLGVTGKPVNKFNHYKSECNNKVIETAKSTFIDGYMDGIKEFCTYDSGYKMANASIPNTNPCPKELRNQFNKGYSAGARLIAEKKAETKRLAEAADRKKVNSSGSGQQN